MNHKTKSQTHKNFEQGIDPSSSIGNSSNSSVDLSDIKIDDSDNIESMFRNEQNANMNDVKELFHGERVKARTDISKRQAKLIAKAFCLAQITGNKPVIALLNDYMTLLISNDRKSRLEFVQGLQAKAQDLLNQGQQNIRGQFGK